MFPLVRGWRQGGFCLSSLALAALVRVRVPNVQIVLHVLHREGISSYSSRAGKLGASEAF